MSADKKKKVKKVSFVLLMKSHLKTRRVLSQLFIVKFIVTDKYEDNFFREQFFSGHFANKIIHVEELSRTILFEENSFRDNVSVFPETFLLGTFGPRKYSWRLSRKDLSISRIVQRKIVFIKRIVSGKKLSWKKLWRKELSRKEL